LFSPAYSPTSCCSCSPFLFRVRVGLSGGAFHRTVTVTSFLRSKVAGRGPLLLPSLASLLCMVRLKECPSCSLQSSGRLALFVMCLFFFSAACLLIFFLFPGLGSVCPGGYADLSPGVLHAAYLLPWWSPKQGRSWHLAVREPFWFLHLMWRGDAMCGLGVWRCWSFVSSWWFFLLGVSPVSLQDFTLRSTLSASSL
jgi:hypothetical protein